MPGRAKVVRDIFRLAIEGRGLLLIVKHLTEAGVEPWGGAAGWSKAYVRKILTGPAAVGTYQPMRDGVPNGDPVPDYYPAAVDQDTFDRAQAAIGTRKGKPGRVGKKAPSLFTGLLHDAATGDRMHVLNQTRGTKGRRQKRRVLVSAGSIEGRAESVSFPVDVFEASVLSCLAEVDPADVLGGEPEGAAATLAAELARVKQSMEVLVKDLEENGDSPAVLGRLREKEAARRAGARPGESAGRGTTPEGGRVRGGQDAHRRGGRRGRAAPPPPFVPRLRRRRLGAGRAGGEVANGRRPVPLPRRRAATTSSGTSRPAAGLLARFSARPRSPVSAPRTSTCANPRT